MLSDEEIVTIRRLLPRVTDPVLLDLAQRYDAGEISFAEFKAQAAAHRERTDAQGQQP